jgi:hypothetical protein
MLTRLAKDRITKTQSSCWQVPGPSRHGSIGHMIAISIRVLLVAPKVARRAIGSIPGGAAPGFTSRPAWLPGVCVPTTFGWAASRLSASP